MRGVASLSLLIKVCIKVIWTASTKLSVIFEVFEVFGETLSNKLSFDISSESVF